MGGHVRSGLPLTSSTADAVASVVSRAVGENNLYRAKRLTTDGLILSLAVVSIFVLLGLTTIRPVFRLLGAEANVLDLVSQYMSVWYVGMFFLVEKD